MSLVFFNTQSCSDTKVYDVLLKYWSIDFIILGVEVYNLLLITILGSLLQEITFRYFDEAKLLDVFSLLNHVLSIYILVELLVCTNALALFIDDPFWCFTFELFDQN